MPEGDSVYRATAKLNEFFAGTTLLGSDFRVPRFATLDLTGWRTLDVIPRGKHLLHHLVHDADGRALTIHSHLKMEGRWDLYQPGQRWRRPGFTARAVLKVSQGSGVGFSLGALDVLPTAQESRLVGHLGPDLLGPDWDPEQAQSKLLAQPERPLGLALLDQSIMAGIGNVFQNEICFLAKVHPASPVRECHVPFVIAESYRLLQANKNLAQRRTTPPLPELRDRYFVYGRVSRPCLLCRTPIRQGSLGEASTPDRVIYFCPRCQG